MYVRHVIFNRSLGDFESFYRLLSVTFYEMLSTPTEHIANCFRGNVYLPTYGVGMLSIAA